MWGLLESVVFVKLFGLLMKCVNKQCTNSGVLRYGNSALYCVLQQGGSYFDALCPTVNCQPDRFVGAPDSDTLAISTHS